MVGPQRLGSVSPSRGIIQAHLLKILIVIGVVIFFYTQFSWAANHYIRAGATGSNNGSDWANAWTVIPKSGGYAQLNRGDTYYVASGSYSGGYYFSTPESGTSTITIKKATVADHGTSTGWSDSYATGQATFGPWEFTTGYWTVDGGTGGGPGSWNSGHGFKFTASWCSGSGFNNHAIVTAGTNFIFRHLEFTNTCPAIDQVSCDGFGGAIRAFEHPLKNSKIEYNYFHDWFGTFIWMYGWNTVTIQYNYFTKLAYGPNFCHGNVINENGKSDNIDVAYNYFYDNTGGQLCGISQGTEQVSNNWRIWGNIFEKGDDTLRWINDSSNSTVANNFKFYNNTIYNFIGNYFALKIDKNTSGTNQAYNNIFYVCNGSAGWRNTTHDYNWYLECGSSGEPHGISGNGDPFINKSEKKFNLSPGSNAINTGVSLGSSYDVDMNGVSHPQGSAWDIGAYKFVTPSLLPPKKVKIISPN